MNIGLDVIGALVFIAGATNAPGLFKVLDKETTVPSLNLLSRAILCLFGLFLIAITRIPSVAPLFVTSGTPMSIATALVTNAPTVVAAGAPPLQPATAAPTKASTLPSRNPPTSAAPLESSVTPVPTIVGAIASAPLSSAATATPTLAAVAPTTLPTPTSTLAPTTLPENSTITRAPGSALQANNPANIVRIGDPYEKDRVEINLVQLEVRTGDGENAALRAWFRFFNKTGQRIRVEWATTDIYAEDGNGNKYGDYVGDRQDSFQVDAGASYMFDRYYSTQPGQKSRVPPDARFVRIVVSQFSRITNASWEYAINSPLGLPVPTPTDAARVPGSLSISDGLQLSVTQLDVRASDTAEPAAMFAAFALTNTSNTPRTVELDFATIHVDDSFGGRYIDWAGGGIESRLLPPGGKWEFQRYYSTMASAMSRVPRGTSFVVLTFRSLGSPQNSRWRLDIVR